MTPKVLRNIHNSRNSFMDTLPCATLPRNKVFKIVVRSRGELEILLGEFFYRMVGTWGGVILTNQTICKAENRSVDTEHQLKSKLAWPVCPKYKIQTKMVHDQCFYWVISWKLLFRGRGLENYWGNFSSGGVDEQIFGWWEGGTSPIPSVGKTLPKSTTVFLTADGEAS